ncbi:MAG TPA: extracellular solute-binding protein [Bacteroidales bacterium]|nr:extracellular solute-binding protein [Bacteroidales bacterium]HPS15738.1 extracellular solute-binding protein [Bacteroidales bacterium]
MKNSITILFAVIIFAASSCGTSSEKKENKTNISDLKGNISISGAFALYPLAQKWADEFCKLNPNVKIDVSAGGAGKGMTDALSGLVSLGMVSREISKEEIDKGAWFIPVTKDAVVPIVNVNNPVLQQLLNKGLDKETLKKIFLTGSVTDWGAAIKNGKIKGKINVYTRSDACGAADVWAKYLGKKQEDIIGTAVSGDPGITEAVKNDKLGIGYNNIGYAYDATSKYVVSGIKILPIDFNGNGMIDDKEYFYQHKDSIVRAIKDGRFPSPPARDLYFVCKDQPKDKVVVEFLKWVLTDGQKYVSDAGYINLSEEKINTALGRLK